MGRAMQMYGCKTIGKKGWRVRIVLPFNFLVSE